MNKKELICALAEKGYTKKKAHAVIDDVFDLVGEKLMEGHEVRLNGIGILSPRLSEERSFWSGLLQRDVIVPRRIQLKFKPSKVFQKDLTAASPMM